MNYRMYFVVTSYQALQLVKKSNATNILVSFNYIKKDKKLYDTILKERNFKILIDSGLYSFSNSYKSEITDKEIKKYYREYKSYIERNCDFENIEGFFELDFDLIGKDYHTFVKPMQEELLKLTDKIILIAQKKRTIDDIKEMCKQNIHCIAIPFASSVERKYFDYQLITDIAHENNLKVHLLGCTDQKYLNDVEQSDSSTYARASAFGEQNIMVGNVLKRFHWRDTDLIPKDNNEERSINCINEFVKMQNYINETKNTIKQLRLF